MYTYMYTHTHTHICTHSHTHMLSGVDPIPIEGVRASEFKQWMNGQSQAFSFFFFFQGRIHLAQYFSIKAVEMCFSQWFR